MNNVRVPRGLLVVWGVRQGKLRNVYLKTHPVPQGLARRAVRQCPWKIPQMQQPAPFSLDQSLPFQRTTPQRGQMSVVLL